jgi:hypothetical protein
MEFKPFPKIHRLSRGMVVTEKIDGTNAGIHIFDVGVDDMPIYGCLEGDLYITASSRTRFIQPGKDYDNFGFAAWVYENSEELAKLGTGSHFGEWWGQGIQRKYGLDERRFSLFNTGRWDEDTLPECCHLVPVLYEGEFSTAKVNTELEALEHYGSYAAPGFMKPEGVVIYLSAARKLFKKTIKDDEGGKGGQS